ncbi:hypothetical protein C3L33_04253, partial [Rhododendron williamsianum]
MPSPITSGHNNPGHCTPISGKISSCSCSMPQGPQPVYASEDSEDIVVAMQLPSIFRGVSVCIMIYERALCKMYVVNQGQMDTNSVRCVVNSISRFIHLVSCQTMNTMPAQKSFRKIASLLKLLKPVLDYVVDHKVPSDEALYQECEELDLAVNEAREFMEGWSSKMSKIYSVLKSELMVMKMQSSSLEICQIVCRLLQSSPSTSSFTAVQELRCLKLEKVSECIIEAIKSRREGMVPPSEYVIEIIDSFSLTSNKELLNESIALEKERMAAQVNKAIGEVDQINDIIDLMSHIRDFMVKLENFKAANGVSIPSYFRCPLSLELMLDPVILASGQTYDRASIKKWLDNGISRCPKTRQKLSHTNLITNYTVKALIENWETENLEHSSTDQSYVHSRSESASSAVSSIELSGEIISECASSSPLNKNSEFSPPKLSDKRQYHSSKTMAEVSGNGNSNYPRTLSFQSPKSGGDDLTTPSQVEKLIEDLRSQSNEVQTSAAAQLRFLAKHNTENRIIIGCSGAIASLLSLLYSEVELTQEHAVTALLNLSINENIKAKIAESGAIDPLIHVLGTGNGGAKENAAAALFSLSVLEEYRVKIGRSSAVKALVDLLHTGTLRGKKDAATALFNLSIFHENKARIIQAGAVKYLVELMDPAAEMIDKAVALLANLSTIAEGCMAIVRAEGIPILVELIETGSQRGKENAASILFQLCINSTKFCCLVLQEGAVPPLVALSQSGTPRAKEKIRLGSTYVNV